MNHSFIKTLEGKRTVFILGTLTFFYPLVIEKKGLVTTDGTPARPLNDKEVLEELSRLSVRQLLGTQGEKPAMLTYKYVEIIPTPTKH